MEQRAEQRHEPHQQQRHGHRVVRLHPHRIHQHWESDGCTAGT